MSSSGGRGYWVEPGSESSLPLEEAFAADVAAFGWPEGWWGVALLGLVDDDGEHVFVVGYAESGDCVLMDDAWVGRATRDALVGLARRVWDPTHNVTGAYAMWRHSDGKWRTRLEAMAGSGGWEMGLGNAVLLAQDIRPWLAELPEG